MRTGAGRAIDAAARETLLTPFATTAGVLLAVSGGPDSMALLRLADLWRRARATPPFIACATVDHGLRPESRQEAAFVATACTALGIRHRTLAWTGEKPVAGVQAAARDARYRLLATAAREEGCEAIATAHTLDDQAETVLMRLAHGSGILGLAAIRPESALDGIRLLRPFLAVSKADLLATLALLGQDFIADPSNADSRFERVRWRAMAQSLAKEGLSPQRLATLARRAGEAGDALLSIAARFPLRVAEGGEALYFDRAAFCTEPRAIRLLVIERAIGLVAGSGARLRLERLETLETRIVGTDDAAVRGTLAGTLVTASADRVIVRPEPPRRRGR